ncbi:hypothetical protein [Streptomyces sp. NPDC102360]|uniref:hypothetical protein n=1 Tax=Streptomyces sp. NPDC102360 TaxID=3366160 RepID=UPI00382A1356
MIEHLEWRGFQLVYYEGVLQLIWSGSPNLEVKAEHCIEASLRLDPGAGPSELVFRFRSTAREASDVIVVRVSVPPIHVQEAAALVRRLRTEHSVPDRQPDEDEAAELTRIPADSPGWIVMPAGTASEELFDEVMERIGNDPG